jgi:hypothetical protein
LVTANGVEIGVDKQLVVAAYADDIVIMAEDEANLKNTIINLQENGKKIGLTINEDNTKYMGITRYNNKVGHLDIYLYDYIFERMDNFKYLGVDINKDTNSHKEINIRLATANKCYFELVPLLKIKYFIMEIKSKIYKVLVRPVALYVCDAWATKNRTNSN